jgi:hypothetical protein
MVTKKASGGDSPLDPPDLASTTAVACSMFRGKLIGPIRFSRRGEYIGGRAASEGGPGAHNTWWRGQGLVHATLWCAWPLVPLHLSFGLCLMLGKIGTLAFILSNSENISCIAFLKHKTAENRELALWHLVSRLVLENA